MSREATTHFKTKSEPVARKRERGEGKRIFIRGPGNCEAYMSVYTAVGQESHLELRQQN